MSSHVEPSEEISAWLASLHLSQYAGSFARAGLRRIRDCTSLDDQRLLEMQVLPTGHRRRILCSLEARGERRAAAAHRGIFPRGGKWGGCRPLQLGRTEKEGLGGRRPSPAGGEPQVGPRAKLASPQSSSSISGNSHPSSSSSELGSDQESSMDDVAASPSKHFQGTMVLNEIYDGGISNDAVSHLRPTRSYRLRHRPVPEIPERTVIPSLERSPLPNCSPPQNPVPKSDSASADVRDKAPPARTLSPICPYGETFLYNNLESEPDASHLKDVSENETKQKKKAKKLWKFQEKVELQNDRAVYSQVQAKDPQREELLEDEYSTVDTCLTALSVTAPSMPKVPHTLPAQLEQNISPYACYYSAPKGVHKAGWLDKLSPQGNCVYQKRWVKFNGEILSYYNNDKDMFSKGFVHISAVSNVRSVGDNKFEVVTSQRVFVFRVEKEGDRYEWINALQIAMRTRCAVSQMCAKRNTNKCGYMELRGYKGRVFVSLTEAQVRLCKTEQDFKSGIGITTVDLSTAHVKDVDRKGFEINTPFRNFCFTAESEREKEEWIEAVLESIAETLSDYEVAEKIWFNKSNRSCADCSAHQPEWASINLGVVICKKCAGQHRTLGPHLSKVRSLKLDKSIWSNELVELFLSVGNSKANQFWAATLSPEDELHPEASRERRTAFVHRKYKERRYTPALEGFRSQEQLDKALCAAVVQPDVMQTMALAFSGANVMCATGDPVYSTPYLLAQKAGQNLQMEFLHLNKLSDFSKLDVGCRKKPPRDVPSFKTGFLYVAVSSGRSVVERRARDEMMRRWCTLEGGFLSYYESEHTATALGRMDLSEVVSLTVSGSDSPSGARAAFTFEVYLLSERVFTFGTETAESHKTWVETLVTDLVPAQAEHLLEKDYKVIGRLHYKGGHDLQRWRVGWFALQESNLYFCPGTEDAEGRVGLVRLKHLQELTVSSDAAGEERPDVLLMLESGRTLYVRGFARCDFALWHSAIRRAAGTDGPALSSQQLSKNDVPIVVESCVAFVTQYGLCYEGIYQKNGNPQRVAQLLESFRKDARSVKLRAGEHQLEDVTDVLKGFLAQTEDAVLTKELYPSWISVLDEEVEQERLQKYSTLIQSLPRINRTTLAALMQHLYRIQKCSGMNQMVTRSLAPLFSSCLFQTEGQTSQEISIIEDLINNYVELFDFSQAGDLIFEVYLEKKEPESCCLIKVSPTMRSDELADTVLNMKNVVFRGAVGPWATFEVIENGELERPLYPKEKVLEQVLEWSTLEDPSSAFLVVKKFSGAKAANSQQESSTDFGKGEHFKFKDGSSKLLSGNKFQDRYVVLRDEKLLLYKDVKNTKPEREVPLRSAKCYLGLRKRMKPPTSWGFTVYREKQQWYFCCEDQERAVKWLTEILRVVHGGEAWPVGRVHHLFAVHQTTRGGATSAAQSGAQRGKTKNGKEVTAPAGEPQEAGESSVSRPFHQRAALVADCLRQRDPPASAAGRHVSGEPSLREPKSAVPWNLSQPRKCMLEREAHLPTSLLQELNSVLSKTGRSTRDEHN
ncbi:arf-GAP with Rho-GAP domain, ANK repeat and PH domain-containing protein 2 isoform X2 [Scleropages formosus]|nr:arf-GAP with Rho-GAP domain, ANK repeat and PH domain-containing protein 2 isoform X2 [Scleropages formosus]